MSYVHISKKLILVNVEEFITYYITMFIRLFMYRTRSPRVRIHKILCTHDYSYAKKILSHDSHGLWSNAAFCTKAMDSGHFIKMVRLKEG